MDYIVWDKSGSIKHIKPGRSTLYADIRVSEAELESIKSELESEESITRDYTIELNDRDGDLHALITKTLYFRSRTDDGK